MMKVNKGQKDKRIGEKNKKRNKGQHADIETHVKVNNNEINNSRDDVYISSELKQSMLPSRGEPPLVDVPENIESNAELYQKFKAWLEIFSKQGQISIKGQKKQKPSTTKISIQEAESTQIEHKKQDHMKQSHVQQAKLVEGSMMNGLNNKVSAQIKKDLVNHGPPKKQKNTLKLDDSYY